MKRDLIARSRKTDIEMSRPTKIEQESYEETVKHLTAEQREFLRLVREGRKDPVFFAENLLGLKLHDGQKLWLWMTARRKLDLAYELGLKRAVFKDEAEFAELIEKNPDSSKNILIPSNRWGKTLVTTVKHLYYNFYKIGATGSPDHIASLRCGTLNLSPHSNQCNAGYQYVLDILNGEFIYKVDGVSYRNECKIKDFYLSDSQQRRTIFFKNGTFYKSVPTGEDQASSLAGNPYLYISYDEAAQSLHLKAELPAKIMSRLIDFGGPVDLVSTPEVDKPSHQYFFHISKLGLKGEEGWWTMLGKIADNTFLGEKEVFRISESIRTTDPAKYRQVMFGEFVTTGKKMFDNLVIERIWDSFSPEMPKYEHKYLVVADWGFADTGDPTVFYVLDYTECLNYTLPEMARRIRIAFVESIRGGNPYAVLTRAKMLTREWNGALFLHDASSMGGVIIKKMLNEMNMGTIIDFSASGDKSEMLFVLISTLSANRRIMMDAEGKVKDENPDFGRVRGYHIPELEDQMGNYQYNPEKGVSDKRLEQDHVMALGMGVWYIERKLLRKSFKDMKFNPLAPTLEGIFPEKEAQKMGIRAITIPEKRIF